MMEHRGMGEEDDEVKGLVECRFTHNVVPPFDLTAVLDTRLETTLGGV